jgi:Carboxypeptidase regulatory-like domain/TonB dependent receptor/TonB-dependent Receptor Plug Domain
MHARSFSPLAFISCALIIATLASFANAQTTAASLTGTIKDSSGSVVPGATITIVNQATAAVVWTGTSDESGNYLAPSLPVGTYDVTVALQGFKTVSTRSVRLEVGQRARLDSTLPIGGVDETVTVVGEAAARLETEDSAIGLVINPSQVQGLPLPGRNVLNLLTLAGGVSSGGAATGITSSQLSINGSRTLNSEFTIDGVSVVSGSTGAPGRLPSTESIREFKVLTASYSAEYGRSAGGTITAVTDSGSNRFSGGAWEYFRHEKLNENNYFNKIRDLPKPTDRYSQFGFKLGGPVKLPGYDGRSKTFFFAVYEGLRRTAPSTVTSTIPDERFRIGDFSASPLSIIDPRTGMPFAGNIIPSDRIDPAARKIMGLLPSPNSSGSADAANGRRTNNYVNDLTNKPKEDEITIRVDHNVGTGSRLYGRFTQYDLFQPSSPTMDGPLNNAAGDSDTKGYQASLGWTQVWSNNVVIETSFGYLRDDPVIDPPTLGIDVADVFGIQRSAFAAAPRFRITGWRELGNNENTYRRQINNNYQAASSLTWVHEGHTLKGGVQFRFNGFDVFNPGGLFTGAYDFTGEITSPTRASGNPVNALADFLLGQVKTASYDLPQPESGRRNFNLAFFAQDDWKLSPRFTVNLGLRYEYESPMWVDNDVHSRLDINPDSVGRLLVAGENASRSLDLDGDKLNFAPRVGLAYTLNDKTVLRSAFGLFYGQIFSNLGGIVLYPGFTVTRDFPTRGTGVAQEFTLSQGHPLDIAQSGDPFFVERNASPQLPLVDNSNQFGSVSPLPYAMQWNAGIQRELWGGTIVDLSYVGSRGVNLPVVRNFNTVPLDRLEQVERANNGLVTQQNRPNPNVSSFAAFVHEGTSDYHSAQVRVSRRFTERLGFQSSYTLARSTDDGSGIFNFSQPNGLEIGDLAGAVDPDINRGYSAFDRTHTFAGAVQYTTGGPWRVLRDLQFNAILIARSGIPSRINQTNLTDWNRMIALPTASALQQRPNLVGDISKLRLKKTVRDGTGVRYLIPPSDPNFPLAPSGPVFANINGVRTLVAPFTGAGSLERGVIRDPGEFNVDMAIARRFPIGDRMGVTLRAEAFNLFNTVNLNGPGGNNNLTVTTDAAGRAVFNSPNFGLITTAKAARFVQLVTRFDF